MTIHRLNRMIAFALGCAPLVASSASLPLLPAQPDDLVPKALSSAKTTAAPADLERKPVAFAWALDPSAGLEKSAPFVAQSREYWKRVSAADLSSGVPLTLTAPGAVLRLSPFAHGSKQRMDVGEVRLEHDGMQWEGARAIERFVDADQLKAAGMEVPEQSIAFRLRPELGAGRFTLSLAHPGDDMLLHVFEPDSGEMLSLGTERDNVLPGEEIAVKANFTSPQNKRAGEIVGTIAAPNGRLFDLTFEPQADASWKATARIEAGAGAGEGLWEVHATAWSDDGTVQRDVRTAFNVALPTAKLAGSGTIEHAKDGALRIALPVQVAAASRYDIGGVIYGTALDGTRQPFAIAHSAAWLEPGKPKLTLSFDASLLDHPGLQAPYELREVTLTDQGSLNLLERRSRALQFDLR
jgi:hypothetical protein